MRFHWFLYVLAAFVLGYTAARFWKPEPPISDISSVILLERMREVFKLAFVEAQFSELLSHKEYQWFDISPFRKSAILRVQATVSAGVDMDSSAVQVEENRKTITLRFDHRPGILYLDHRLDYYDLQQGTFNYFSPEELSTLQDQARAMILKKAAEGDLLIRAGKKRDEMIRMLESLLQSVGWKLVVEDAAVGRPEAGWVN